MSAVPPMLVKLLMMTTSPNDGEALTAIRKANAMLAGANVNWEEFLKAVQTTNAAQADQSFRTPPSQRRYRHDDGDDFRNAFTDVGRSPSQKFTNAKIIDPMFEVAFANASGGFADFLNSVHEWWEEKGFLTEKQYYAVKRAAEK
jgi:hypothetical protein